MKIIGVFLIVAGFAGVGWYFIYGYILRIKILEELEQALQYIYGEIEYSGSNMVQVIASLGKRANYLKNYWEKVSEDLFLYNGQTFKSIWNTDIRYLEGRTRLKKADISFLENLGANLGNLDRKTQLGALSLFQDRLKNIIQQAREEYRGKARVTGVCAITAGLLLCIALY